jgi:cell division protein FtsN
MPKDFAHRGGGRQTTSGSAMPGWVWLLVGVAIGFVGAAGWYISRPRAVEAAVEQIDKALPGKKKITIPPKQPSRFAFYELLPSQEVVIPKETLKPKPGSPPREESSPAARYLIQVGSFKDHNEADQQRATLALLGIESRVEKVTIDNTQTWYRVRIGPEKDQRKVESILARLEDNDIQGMVMMVPVESRN